MNTGVVEGMNEKINVAFMVRKKHKVNRVHVMLLARWKWISRNSISTVVLLIFTAHRSPLFLSSKGTITPI